jgi:hypothetical protein
MKNFTVSARHRRIAPMTLNEAPRAAVADVVVGDDSYLWLEAVDGEEVQDWVERHNGPTLARLSGERFEQMRADVLDILDSDCCRALNLPTMPSLSMHRKHQVVPRRDDGVLDMMMAHLLARKWWWTVQAAILVARNRCPVRDPYAYVTRLLMSWCNAGSAGWWSRLVVVVRRCSSPWRRPVLVLRRPPLRWRRFRRRAGGKKAPAQKASGAATSATPGTAKKVPAKKASAKK